MLFSACIHMGGPPVLLFIFLQKPVENSLNFPLSLFVVLGSSLCFVDFSLHVRPPHEASLIETVRRPGITSWIDSHQFAWSA